MEVADQQGGLASVRNRLCVCVRGGVRVCVCDCKESTRWVWRLYDEETRVEHGAAGNAMVTVVGREDGCRPLAETKGNWGVGRGDWVRF